MEQVAGATVQGKWTKVILTLDKSFKLAKEIKALEKEISAAVKERDGLEEIIITEIDCTAKTDKIISGNI
jgi:hypothetical protein